MAYTTIKKPSDYFNTKLFTGNNIGNQSQSVTGVGFQPDWTWIKNRSQANSNHRITDAVRGVTKEIYSDLTAAEATNTNGLTAFGSDGFTVGSNGDYNNNGSAIASWNWKANGAGVANTDGSISSTVSANTTSGFSIITYTGTGTAGTIGHGLAGTPDFWMTKARSETRAWYGWHTGIDLGKVVNFNSTNAASTDTSLFTSNAPTSTVYNVGTSVGTNNSGITFVTYAFKSVKGYSKFGSFVGSSSQQFIYLGFKPRWFMWKNTSQGDATYDHWGMVDTARQTPNGATDGYMRANQNSAESSFSGNGLFFLSNGIQFNNTGRYNNNSGDTYIYMAFAEEPLVGDNPATAR